jgi:hypothetical protein
MAGLRPGQARQCPPRSDRADDESAARSSQQLRRLHASSADPRDTARSHPTVSPSEPRVASRSQSPESLLQAIPENRTVECYEIRAHHEPTTAEPGEPACARVSVGDVVQRFRSQPPGATPRRSEVGIAHSFVKRCRPVTDRKPAALHSRRAASLSGTHGARERGGSATGHWHARSIERRDPFGLAGRRTRPPGGGPPRRAGAPASGGQRRRVTAGPLRRRRPLSRPARRGHPVDAIACAADAP